MKTVLKIEFDSKSIAEHFASWLCGSGEQQYWNWMEYREQEEDGDITAVSFEYFPEEENAEFIGDLTIRTKSGRLGR